MIRFIGLNERAVVRLLVGISAVRLSRQIGIITWDGSKMLVWIRVWVGIGRVVRLVGVNNDYR